MQIPGSNQQALSFTQQPRALSFDGGPERALPLFAQAAPDAIAFDPDEMLGSGKAIDIEFRRHLDAAGKSIDKDEKTQRERIHSTAQDLEGLLLGTMLKQVWQGLGKNPLFGEDRASEMYREMWVDEVSKSIASGPQSLGIAKMAEGDMLRSAGLSLDPQKEEAADKPLTAPEDAKRRLNADGQRSERRDPNRPAAATIEVETDAVQVCAMPALLSLFGGPASNVAEARPLPGAVTGGFVLAQGQFR